MDDLTTNLTPDCRCGINQCLAIGSRDSVNPYQCESLINKSSELIACICGVALAQTVNRGGQLCVQCRTVTTLERALIN